MLSFTFLPTQFLVSRRSFADLSTHFCCFSISEPSSRRKKQRRKRGSLQLVAVEFLDAKKRVDRDCGFGSGGRVLRRCKKDWSAEGDLALEAQILEFMKSSENPEVFPSKKRLIDAGRMDLVEGILKQGGWLASGWDMEDVEVEEEAGLHRDCIDLEYSIRDKECKGEAIQDSVSVDNPERSSEVSFLNANSAASSSGRSLEAVAEDDSGIEGILNRLEKERNMNFGLGSTERGSSTHVQSNDFKHEWLAKTSKNGTVAGLKRSGRPTSLKPNNDVTNNSCGKLGHNRSLTDSKPDTWKTWSIQRAGLSNMEFEADEFSYSGTRAEGKMDSLGDTVTHMTEGTGASLNGKVEDYSHRGIAHGDIRSRLQHLELELSSVLNTLKSNSCHGVSQEDHASSHDDLLKLSDAWEFQENEILNAQDKLRSVRAKLSVLEGKMALAIIDAQKIVEQKQKRIDDAGRALQLLCTACIVWPNSASEVFLAGSFDGWTTQRRMDKSSTGIFSLYLKLYPGRYEIKFIVDGEWRIDPLRPVVYNNGYENNLLLIT